MLNLSSFQNYSNGSHAKLSKRVLPILALNEVFVGESLSSRVSYLEIRHDDDPHFVKTRNSGEIRRVDSLVTGFCLFKKFR